LERNSPFLHVALLWNMRSFQAFSAIFYQRTINLAPPSSCTTPNTEDGRNKE